MELTFSSKKSENEQKSIAANMGEAGAYIYVDNNYARSIESIEEHHRNFKDTFISTKVKEKTHISDFEKELLEMCRDHLKYVMRFIPQGKPSEKAWMAKKAGAIQRIIARAEACALSDIEEDRKIKLILDYFHKIDTVVGFTFDSTTNSIQKTFTHLTTAPMTGSAGGVMDENTKEALMEAARQRSERKMAKKS